MGAPPDQYNQVGQDWSQPPWRPDRLEELGYVPYRDLLRTVLRSLFGHVIQGIRINEPRMRALGYPVFRYKLVSFVLAGALLTLAVSVKPAVRSSDVPASSVNVKVPRLAAAPIDSVPLSTVVPPV